MGWHEYRSTTALGGVVPGWLYRRDVAWLDAEARQASRWTGRAVRQEDVVHALVRARRLQGALGLRPGRREAPEAAALAESPATGLPGGPMPLYRRRDGKPVYARAAQAKEQPAVRRRRNGDRRP